MPEMMLFISVLDFEYAYASCQEMRSSPTSPLDSWIALIWRLLK